MTNEHTPGPWAVRKIQDQITVRGPETNGLSMEIADINPHINPFVHGYSAEDNARLIAAAPDLLAALKDTLWAIDQFKKRTDLDLERSYPVLFDHLPRARAAIAKVRGESC